MEKAPARSEKNGLTSLERDCVEALLGRVSEGLGLHWRGAKLPWQERVSERDSVVRSVGAGCNPLEAF